MKGILTTVALLELLCFSSVSIISPPPACAQESANNTKADAAAVLEAHKRAVFRIFALSPAGMMSGTGFLVSEKGWVATNRHVINHADTIYVSILSERGSSAQLHKAVLIKDDIDNDLAILQLETVPTDLPDPFSISADMPKVFDEVIAIGFPAALDQPISELADFSGRAITDETVLENLEPNLTKGAISKVGSWVIHDAKIGAGNSGGPLVDAKTGDLVVGVNTARTMGGTAFYKAVPSSKLTQLYFQVEIASSSRKKMEEKVAQGDHLAMLYLGEHLCNGKDGYPHDVERGISLLEEAAEAGIDDAHIVLGNLYSEGKEVKADIQKAIQHFEKVKTLQSEMYQFIIYAYGTETVYETQPDKAFNVAKKMQEEYPDSIGGDSCMADCYKDGIGTKKSLKKAIELRKGICERLRKDDPRGELLTEEYSLGQLLLLSNDKSDREQGVDLLNSHAEHKDYETCGMACNALSIYYGGGKGKRADWEKHVHYLRIGAEVKNETAMANLAIAYAQGRGVEPNMDAAVALANEAVERGCSQEVYSYIGVAYIKAGRVQLGMAYLNRAAEAGSAIAQCRLSYYYLTGENGVKKDRGKAISLLKQAANSHDDPTAGQLAKDLLNTLNSSGGSRSSRNSRSSSQRGQGRSTESKKSTPNNLPKRSARPW